MGPQSCQPVADMHVAGLQNRMADPATASNPTEYQKVAKAAAELEEQVSAYSKYRSMVRALQEAKEMLRESDGAVFLQKSRLLHGAWDGHRSLTDSRLRRACPGCSGDPEMAELAREEIASLTAEVERIVKLLKVLLLPKDPMDEKNIMLEASTSFPAARSG